LLAGGAVYREGKGKEKKGKRGKKENEGERVKRERR